MIHFDAASHRYTYSNEDGTPLVVFASVTQVLKAGGFYGDAERHFDDYSRDRGTAVHETIRLYHAGRLDPVNTDPVIEPYLDAWAAFIAESKFVPAMLEKRLHDPMIRVAGTADVIGPYEGRAAILDIKTGAAHPATAIQLAGYEHLYGAACRRIGVHLQADGKYRLHEYKDRHDRDVFLGAVAIHNWRLANLKGEKNGD